jgi:hypothetical protein
MVSSRNVQDVVLFLKKELVKAQDDSYEKVKKIKYYITANKLYT